MEYFLKASWKGRTISHKSWEWDIRYFDFDFFVKECIQLPRVGLMLLPLKATAKLMLSSVNTELDPDLAWLFLEAQWNFPGSCWRRMGCTGLKHTHIMKENGFSNQHPIWNRVNKWVVWLLLGTAFLHLCTRFLLKFLTWHLHPDRGEIIQQ